MAFERIGDALGEIKVATDNADSAASAIWHTVTSSSDAAAGMLDSSREVSVSTESIAAVAQENSAAAEEVSAATEEMSAQAEEVMASAATLAELAGQLAAVVAPYTLDRGDGQPFGSDAGASVVVPYLGRSEGLRRAS
jgi:methyl-accepting chemotaxis protein